MIKTVLAPVTNDIIKIPASKSEVHRLLICAALSDSTTKIFCDGTNEDIEATAGCLRALGAEIIHKDGGFTVKPLCEAPEKPVLCCNESGSTLRFLLPVTAFFGKDTVFTTKGRLGDRPLSPLKEELEGAGVTITKVSN